MKNRTKFKISIMAFAVIAFSFIANSEHSRCADICVPKFHELCSVGSGTPGDPVVFCEDRVNMNTIPTID